jgi:hypothetical protein
MCSVDSAGLSEPYLLFVAAMKIKDFPCHLQNELEKLKNCEAEEIELREKERNMLNVRLNCYFSLIYL